MIDLTATYTTVNLRTGEPLTITPAIKTRTRGGITITSISGLAPLLADKIDAITNEGDRLHTLQVLQQTGISIRSDGDEEQAEGATQLVSWRDHGRLMTSYPGTKDLSVSQVLDLAAAIRAQLA